MSRFPFIFGVYFLSLFWPPSESAVGGKNSLQPYVFDIGVGGCFGMIPGVLLPVTRACTLGVARILRAWLASTMFVPCSPAVFLNFLLHCQISVLMFPKLIHYVPCFLWVPLRYFGLRLRLILRSSQLFPLGFPSVFGYVWGTACIGLTFCIRQLMGF